MFSNFYIIKNKILLCVLIFLYCINLSFANTVETQLSQNSLTLNDSLYVTFNINNNTSNVSPDFSVLQKDFQILKTDYGNTVNMVNGVTSMQTFWQLQLKPKRMGTLMIPPINFGNDKSEAHKLVVTANQVVSNAKTTLSAMQNVRIFAHGEINNTSPYVNSQVLYTFKLYFRDQIIDPRIEIPSVTDMTFVPLNNHPGYQTTINGILYNVAEKTFAIFPKKPGAMNLPPMQFHAFSIDEDSSPFTGPFNFDAPKAVSVATKNINLSVRDVPANYPGTIWLPAKNISLTEQWSNKEKVWELGTPVTRIITVEAQDMLAEQLPDISIDKINGVNVYVDKPKRTNNIQNESVIGVLQQKVTYIPTTTQSLSIPPIKINWWNTQTDSNAVAQLHGINVQIKDVIAGSTPNSFLAPTLTPINTSETSYEKKILANAFYTSIWFWIACALLVGWLVTLWTMRRNKSVNSSKAEILITTFEVSDKHFTEACHTGQAGVAKQYLLGWAKKQWPGVALNLAILGELINDKQFQLALQELEQSLYARKPSTWNGKTLLSAWQRIKKTRKYLAASDIEHNKPLADKTDPLPPLNPSH